MKEPMDGQSGGCSVASLSCSRLFVAGVVSAGRAKWESRCMADHGVRHVLWEEAP
jgi:hypothetical protein